MPGCPGKFMCRSDNTCLPLSARCNGITECRDRSDEDHCGKYNNRNKNNNNQFHLGKIYLFFKCIKILIL